jgi:hypothetical protein
LDRRHPCPAADHGCTHGRLDGGGDEIALDPEEDWPEVEASKRPMIGRRDMVSGIGPARLTIL